jgi:hypothetical protein
MRKRKNWKANRFHTATAAGIRHNSGTFLPSGMKKCLLIITAQCCISWVCFSQSSFHIETSDIDRFWSAYDSLTVASNRADSIAIFQRLYIDQASPSFQKFIKLRKFTAEEYVLRIKKAPKFWASVRPFTEAVSNRTAEIEETFGELEKFLPGFAPPDVCFAIGTLRTGGTTSKNLVLIGSEISAADTSVDVSELGSWLRSIIGHTGDLTSMVAHEAIHTRQKGIPGWEIFKLIRHQKLSLLNMSILEGSADFVTEKAAGLNINRPVHTFASQRKCELRQAFLADINAHPFDYSRWLYNGGKTDLGHADLGYYIGYVISEQFYNSSTDKEAALKLLMRRGKYKKVFRKSGFKEQLEGCP